MLHDGCSEPESQKTVYETASTNEHDSMSGMHSPSLASTQSPKNSSRRYRSSWVSGTYRKADEEADDEMGSESGVCCLPHLCLATVMHSIVYKRHHCEESVCALLSKKLRQECSCQSCRQDSTHAAVNRRGPMQAPLVSLVV